VDALTEAVGGLPGVTVLGAGETAGGRDAAVVFRAGWDWPAFAFGLAAALARGDGPADAHFSLEWREFGQATVGHLRTPHEHAPALAGAVHSLGS
jgi:hypothetical protein